MNARKVIAVGGRPRGSAGEAVFYALMSSFVLQATGAQAQNAQGDVFSARVSHTHVWDSNLFRRSASNNPRSDVIGFTSGTLRVDKRVSQQQFLFELTENLSRYQNSSYLNFDGSSYSAAWSLHSGSWLNMGVVADHTKSLAPFEDTLTSLRNVRIEDHKTVNFDGHIYDGLNWVGSLARAEKKSEQAIANQPSSRTTSASLGMRYAFQSGSHVEFVQHASRGDYLGQSTVPSATGKSFKENSSEILVFWKLSGISDLTGRVTHRKREDNQQNSRNYSGSSGDIAYGWRPAATVNVLFAAKRDLSPLQDPSFSYIRNELLSVSPSWSVSSFLQVHMLISKAASSYRGSGILPPTNPAREDTTYNTEAGIDWLPAQKLMLSVNVQHQVRRSNFSPAEYRHNVVRAGAVWSF